MLCVLKMIMNLAKDTYELYGTMEQQDRKGMLTNSREKVKKRVRKKRRRRRRKGIILLMKLEFKIIILQSVYY